MIQPDHQRILDGTESLARLLDETEHFIRRFVMLSDDQAVGVTLHVGGTYVYDRFRTTPYLFATSPDEECGKSTLLDVHASMARKPWPVVEPTEAVVFRKVDRDHPTMYIDEADSLFTKQDDRAGLRAVLNAGYTKSKARVPRCIGKGADMKLQEFDVYCPKVIAGVGEFLPPTLRSRTVPIRLERLAFDEFVEDADEDIFDEEGGQIRSRWEQWAAGSPALDIKPPMPALIRRRQKDSWRVLLAIADAARGQWPKRARQAAVNLFGGSAPQSSIRGLALEHLREIAFDRTPEGMSFSARLMALRYERIPTEDVLRALVKRDDGPWAGWWGADVELNRINGPAAKLANILRDYKTVKARQFKERESGGKPHNLRGYVVEDFADLFDRYLPPFAHVPDQSREPATAQVDGYMKPLPESEVVAALEAPDQQGSDFATSSRHMSDQEEFRGPGCPECRGITGHRVTCSEGEAWDPEGLDEEER
jgi:Protein of unknown function (DUF3631)